MPPIDQLISLYKQQGWNNDASIRADIAAGGWKSKVQSGAPQLQSYTQPSSSSNFQITQPSQPAIDVGAIAKQQLQMQQEANKPAIATLEGQKQPLQDRYKAVIADIQAKKGVAVKQGEIATAREFGKRGIPTSSGAYDVALQENINPINATYGGLETQAVTGEQTDLMNLATQIASLQSGNIPGAFQSATQLAQLQAELNRPQEVITEVVTAGGRKLLVNKQTGQTIQDLGASETSSGTDMAWLQNLFGGGLNPEPKPTAPPTTPKATTAAPTTQRGGYGYNTYYG